jgi:phosphoribosylaminoimidazolecarboxamide formyltransferase/IMP cyclohydrolase
MRRALVSVSDKTGIVDFARALANLGVELLSTGGTFRALEEAGIPVKTVESYTESPEVMDGRVKTLHPRIHAGLLSRSGVDDEDMERLGAKPIDLVVVNLYPFEQTLAKNASFEDLIENIDIGGPTMLRSAAKNHSRVAVVVDSADYAPLLEEIKNGGEISGPTKRRLAAKVFAHTAAYDGAIANWMNGLDTEGFSESLNLNLSKVYDLRYGENPHQKGAFYAERSAPIGSLARAESLGSGAKQLSFNNLVDLEAAVEAVRDFEGPAAAVIKHASPCGLATASTLKDAYHAAREADAMSAFGGIVALNRPVDAATAEIIAETFIECVIAPSFDEAALARLTQKKALRILATGEWLGPDHGDLQLKRIGGGLVVQSRDATSAGEVLGGEVVTKLKPSDAQMRALEFAWTACKHVKSNAIVLARQSGDGFATVGIGGGQTARVLAVEGACKAAGDAAKGSVMASDAFFPFPDALETAAQAGVAAVAQPGGSKQDASVIEAADKAGLAMVFTATRHFRH